MAIDQQVLDDLTASMDAFSLSKLRRKQGVAVGLKKTSLDIGAVAGPVTLDVSLANYFTINPTGDLDLTITNPPADNETMLFYIYFKNGGAVVINWPTNVMFESANAPVLTAVGEDLLSVSFNTVTKNWGVSLEASNWKTL